MTTVNALDGEHVALPHGMETSLASGFLHWADRTPESPALVVQNRPIAYGQLRYLAARIAATIQHYSAESGNPFVAVFGERSEAAFASVLGVLMSGHGYLPLSPHAPAERSSRMLQHAGCKVLIADPASLEALFPLLDAHNGLLVLMPNGQTNTALPGRWPQHRFVQADALAQEGCWNVPVVHADDPAYLLFTSGSTGIPKGVCVSHGNATHFVRHIVRRYGLGPVDRLSQTFDLTFDLSVFDMFAAWECGARLCVPSRTELWNPDRFIRDQALTVWFSVPSLALLMQRVGCVTPGRFPSLRWSLFCGERLPVDTAAQWAAAAQNSILENLYGPTELTVACMAFRPEPSALDAHNAGGVVPIGYALPEMEVLVVDEEGREVAPGQAGELLVTGPQRTAGYWRDPDATRRAHVSVPGRPGVYYRTGDRVRRPAAGEPFEFLGRVDHQVKVLGHRVELGEIEAHLLDAPGVESAAAVGWPLAASGALGIVAFVTGRSLDPVALRSTLMRKLATYAVPQRIQVLTELPRNPNGKVDRTALLTWLEAS